MTSPRFVRCEPLLIAGQREFLTENADKEIPLLWQKFMLQEHRILHRVNRNFYGLCIRSEKSKDDFYYMAGCLVTDFTDLRREFSPIILSSETYAVFIHDQHVSKIRETIAFAFDEWLPNSAYRLVERPTQSLHFFELYTEEFNPDTGFGGMEIWIPVASN